MAHDIQENDKAIRPAKFPVSWHGLEDVSEGLITLPSHMPMIAYPVVKQPLILPPDYVLAGDGCKNMIVGLRPEKPLVIATCSDQYEVLGNDHIFERAMAAFEKCGIEAELTFALTMGNGKRVSYSFEIVGNETFQTNGDENRLNINIGGSHDKTTGVWMFGSGTRVVCANTLAMAMGGKKMIMNEVFFHDKAGVAMFAKLPERVEDILNDVNRFQNLSTQMANFPISLADAQAVTVAILAGSDKEISSQVFNQSEAIALLYAKGKGNKGQTFYDLLCGVTEYFTSGDGSGKTVSKFQKAVNADFGSAAEKKVMFLKAFQDESGNMISEENVKLLVSNGYALIKAYEANQQAKELAKAAKVQG